MATTRAWILRWSTLSPLRHSDLDTRCYQRQWKDGARLTNSSVRRNFEILQIPSSIYLNNSFPRVVFKRWIFMTLNNDLSVASKRLSDLIRRPFDLYRAGVFDEYIMGLMNQVAQAMDDSITQEVWDFFFLQRKYKVKETTDWRFTRINSRWRIICSKKPGRNSDWTWSRSTCNEVVNLVFQVTWNTGLYISLEILNFNYKLKLQINYKLN